VPATGDDSFHRSLLRLRHEAIVPRLAGTRTIDAKPIGKAAVAAYWRLGDGAVLALAANFAAEACAFDPPSGRCLFMSRDGALDGTRLGGRSTVAFLAS
jgi:hypothetical protein